MVGSRYRARAPRARRQFAAVRTTVALLLRLHPEQARALARGSGGVIPLMRAVKALVRRRTRAPLHARHVTLTSRSVRRGQTRDPYTKRAMRQAAAVVHLHVTVTCSSLIFIKFPPTYQVGSRWVCIYFSAVIKFCAINYTIINF